MRHANLSIFVPHQGCPNQCSFCNQRSISGAADAPSGMSAAKLCAEAETHLRGRCADAEIAFFGGSFTAIPRGYMQELLEAVYPFTERGVFKGIRISTRPDCIDDEVLDLLEHYHVTAIELGAQSMSDRVLEMNRRGHSAGDVERSARLIASRGFELGLQMMTGLYGSDSDEDLQTAQKLAELSPQTVRVYPTIVMEGTRLAELWRENAYNPQTLDEAITLGARLLELFGQSGIRVIRMGLHAQDSLESGMLAGPYHPAYRELCEGTLMRKRLERTLGAYPAGSYIVYTAPKSISKLTGHGAHHVDDLRNMGYNIKIKQDTGLTGYAMKIEEV